MIGNDGIEITLSWNVSTRKLLPAVSWNNIMFLSIPKNSFGTRNHDDSIKIFLYQYWKQYKPHDLSVSIRIVWPIESAAQKLSVLVFLLIDIIYSSQSNAVVICKVNILNDYCSSCFFLLFLRQHCVVQCGIAMLLWAATMQNCDAFCQCIKDNISFCCLFVLCHVTLFNWLQLFCLGDI